jgi:acyl carrier protein
MTNQTQITTSTAVTSSTVSGQTDDVLRTVAAMLRTVIGEAWVDEIEITRETSFNGDLELESIEFVTLAEQLNATYGAGVDFTGWLSQKELGEIIGLRVGDVVEFIERCL